MMKTTTIIILAFVVAVIIITAYLVFVSLAIQAVYV